MRKGMNQKNIDYWTNEIFVKFHKMQEPEARQKAIILCHGQEIKMLKDRIIKLEKRFKKIK